VHQADGPQQNERQEPVLSEQDNDLLTRVGPGTVMGSLMRQYWLPALLSSELPEPGCRPVRVLLLGERLVGFRAADGRVGLLAHGCPHRGASLYFGRSESDGLRCAYHGWKFDRTGRCLDAPTEPGNAERSRLMEDAAAVAYPTAERGGIVWAYLGPRSTPPALPLLEANMLPAGEGQVTALIRGCNWLQGLEGDLDTSHLAFLHFGGLAPATTQEGSFVRLVVEDRSPRYHVLDTEAGTMYSAYRGAGPDWTYHRIAYFLFPFYALLESNILGQQVRVRAWVPMDDDHLMFFGMYSDTQQAPAEGEARQRTGYEMLPNGTDWLARFRPVANADNDYLIDRERQRRGDYTGIAGISTQDASANESMGKIAQRSDEHLGSADAMIIRVRQRLLDAANGLRESGAAPPGVETPGAYAVRSGGVILPSGVDWVQATETLRRSPISAPRHGAE
jgi:phthalate 4,5-dioxygenase oxygenase subunit